MKSPQDLVAKLAQQWQSADWRERQLLGGASAWPVVLSIGQPTTQVFMGDSSLLQRHLQQWRSIEQQGPGTVQWQARRYRGSNDVIEVPTHWQLARPSEWLAAIQQLKAPGHAQIRADYTRLSTIIMAVKHNGFQCLLVRRLTQWQGILTKDIISAAQMALQLEPGCAQGKPLRALSVQGNDSKFYERHAGLLTALLDERFDKEVSRQGLTVFLGALAEDDHWLLVVPLAPGLLPFARQRVPASELQATQLPATRILLVENERSLHQLPQQQGTIAILGAGLNLNWLDAPWLRERSVAYWGDLDTWGLAMLATARQHLPHLHALLMDRNTFDTHSHLAVTEPVHAQEFPALPPEQAALDAHLRGLERGRLEQEFLPASLVKQAVQAWANQAATI
ncbi:Wadjet anti-phage system protein JetD domain-containing protein [Comamonas testosteroni]|uniref:Wadjet anti-phage system protein JetD domain-containing protein n=1 Tax=Comamonas testosteroni TaxID=285 RepID=UPI0015FC7409|nr:Wadjet anti-phage system protein JetD domain-containing protein [Comamonas testosteroni]